MHCVLRHGLLSEGTNFDTDFTSSPVTTMMASNPYHSHPPPPVSPSKPSEISQARDMTLTRSTISIRNSPDGFQTNKGNDGHDNLTAHRRRQRSPDDDDRIQVSQPENLSDFNCNQARCNQEQSSGGRQYGGVGSWESYEQEEKKNDFNNIIKNGNDRGDNDRISSTGNIIRSENHNDKSANFDPNDPNNQARRNSSSFTEENDRGDTIEKLPGKRNRLNSPNQSGINGNNGANHCINAGSNVNQTNTLNPENNLPARPDNFHSRNNNSSNDGHQNDSNCNQSHNSFNNPTSCNQNSSIFKHEYQVLYTHQKTKKKKSWKDGRLVLHNTRASLYDAVPIPGSAGGIIDSLDLTTNEARCLRDGYYDGELESEKFLITVEGPWNAVGGGSDGSGDGTDNNDNDGNNPLWNNPTAQSTKRHLQQRRLLRQRQQPSASMKKLLNNKFRIPQKIIPLHPEEKRRREAMNGGGGMAKRSRPLQPGELERRFYGDSRGTYGHCGYHDDARGDRHGGGGYGSERGYDNDLHCRTNGQQGRFGMNHNVYTHDEAERVRHNKQEFRCNDQQRSYGGGFQQRRAATCDRGVNDPKRIRRMEGNPDSTSSHHQWDCGDPPEYAGENYNNENHGPSKWNDSGKNDQFDGMHDYQGSAGTGQHFRSQDYIGRGCHGPSKFVSDGFDPRGLYGEEDEEGDECSADEGDKGEDEIRDSQYENQQADDLSDNASTMLSQSHGQKYTTIPSKHDTSSLKYASPHSRDFYSTSQEDEKQTEELLALFDDNPSQNVQHSDSHDDDSSAKSVKQRDDKDRSGQNRVENGVPRYEEDDNNHAQSDSFIASIREADRQDDDAGDGWDCTFSSIHSRFEWGDDDDTGVTCDEDGDSCPDKNVTNDTIDERVSGFSLPSPGESSSEGDETDGE